MNVITKIYCPSDIENNSSCCIFYDFILGEKAVFKSGNLQKLEVPEQSRDKKCLFWMPSDNMRVHAFGNGITLKFDNESIKLYFDPEKRNAQIRRMVDLVQQCGLSGLRLKEHFVNLGIIQHLKEHEQG